MRKIMEIIELPYCEGVDFQKLDRLSYKELSRFERETKAAMAIDPSNTTRLLALLKATVEEFPQSERIVLQKRLEGWPDQKIADLLKMSRQSVIRKRRNIIVKLDVIVRDIRKIYKV